MKILKITDLVPLSMSKKRDKNTVSVHVVPNCIPLWVNFSQTADPNMREFKIPCERSTRLRKDVQAIQNRESRAQANDRATVEGQKKETGKNSLKKEKC